MAVKTEDLEPELLESVCERVREQLPEEVVSSCQSFVRQYYQWVPAADLAERTPLDLYGAAVALWNLAQQRDPGEASVRVYNPDRDEHGWQSPYTVVEIVSDDMPFIVDSITMELGRQGFSIDLVIHPVIRVRRDQEGRLQEVLEADATDSDAIAESILHAEVVRERGAEELHRLQENVERVLGEVRGAVGDWHPMRSRTSELIEELERHPPPIDEDEVEEVEAFLAWLSEDHFTFLGYREYELTTRDDEAGLKALAETGLGILRGPPNTPFKALGDKALQLARAPHLLVLTQTTSRSTVHRPAYLDYIGVRRFDERGWVVGECRFLGLYTSAAYRSSLRQIPLLRGKMQAVLDRAGFSADSHDAKALVEILESYPREALFQVSADELFEIAIGMLGVGERPRVRLFVRRDPLDRFLSCLVTIPRDRYNTETRERVADILMEEFGGTHLDWNLQLSESMLARVHYIVRREDGVPEDYDVEEIEGRIIGAIRKWSDDLRQALIDEHGEERGVKLHKRYEQAFPPGYRADWTARSAVGDVARLEELDGAKSPIIVLGRPAEAQEDVLRAKLFSSAAVSLSDVLPTFEHMGAKVVDERPYEVNPHEVDPAWVYDFGLRCGGRDVERVQETFQETFLGVWRGELEDDGLNGLVLHAGLSGNEITIVRAIARYLRQARIAYSDAYMERTLIAHPDIARLLVKLFRARFDPEGQEDDADSGRSRDCEAATDEIEEAIDAVESLDEDRILRSFLSVVRAMLRTNYFRRDEGDRGKPFLSFKLDPSGLAILPLPRPRFEIFVYSPRFEGVHLRGGKVARGGVRWSDRPEDFRSEVLGLMKAQMVKNALIVPVGAKGGFILKRPPSAGDEDGREALNEEAVACYKMFLAGLLDVTDNIVDGEVRAPERVVRYDDDDPYLVVAADKGTAAFSDIANEVSSEYGFWLGDAFASGGSHGYDHKEMGITATGAWEAVTRHFRELGTDIQSTEFTVVGIGDMSGDVFGNGMLLSPHIKLIAAFNHRHVFLDPNPDPKASFEQRKRMFEMERSDWGDYDSSCISQGGGVHERTAKKISISSEVKEVLAIEADELPPSELIREILRAPVDLLWNGGVGTYVKASGESSEDVGDKANDSVRVSGRELRCRVVGEGGNLGFTQSGRIEYALAGGKDGEGGRINTDAIDNVGGVNCSDHEVNIKVLLDSVVASGGRPREERGGDERGEPDANRGDDQGEPDAAHSDDQGEPEADHDNDQGRRQDGALTEEERNELLVEMTDAVAERVLYGSYVQGQAVSLAMAQAAPMIDVHARLIRHLEQVAGLDREIEYLPSEETIDERKAAHQGLVSPEVAVVMAYCKIHLYARLLESDLPEDSYLGQDLERYFPAPLPERYSEHMSSHRLRREIIATVVANQLVDRAGTTFTFRLGEETGAQAPTLARAFAVAREVFQMRSSWSEIERLDNEVEAAVQLQMLIECRRLVERATRWLVRSSADSIDIAGTIERFQPGAKSLADAIPEVLEGSDREAFEQRSDQLQKAGVPGELAGRVAKMPSMVSVFDIVEVAELAERDQEAVMSTYFRLGSRLELNWLRDRIVELPRANRWQALARTALRDDLYGLHRALTQEVLEAGGSDAESDESIDEWSRRNGEALERYLGIVGDIKASRSYDTTTLPVALREVRNLIRGGASEDEGVRGASEDGGGRGASEDGGARDASEDGGDEEKSAAAS